MRDKLLNQLSDRSIEDLDGATEQAFEAITQMGFEPFLLFGRTPSSILASRTTIGLDSGGYFQTYSKQRYMVVLVASDPKYTFEHLRETHEDKEAVTLVPSETLDGTISDVIIHDYRGECISMQGRI